MRLTTYTDYALRVLMYVALKVDGLATIGDISESYGISRHHLTKVVHQLGRLGYLQNVRGRKGGIRLAVPPHAINVGTLIRQIEGDTALVQCFTSHRPRCRIERRCVLSSTLDEALSAFFSVLDHRTLADLVGPRRALVRLLRGENERNVRARGA